jgi:hypothetical protein
VPCGLPGSSRLFYSAVGHGVIGAVTGGIFPIQALLGLMVLAVIESIVAATVLGQPMGLWLVANLAAIQVGYLGGICIRCLLEKVGLAERGTRVNHS